MQSGTAPPRPVPFPRAEKLPGCTPGPRPVPGADRIPDAKPSPVQPGFPVQTHPGASQTPPPVPTHSRCRPVSRCRLIPLQTRPGADRHRQPPLGPGGHKQLTPSGLKRGSSRYFPAPGPGPDGAAQPQASPSPVRRRRPARLHRPGAPSGPGAPGEPGEPGVPGVSGHRPRTMICGRKARPAAEQPRSPSDGSGGPRRPGRALKKMGESRGRSRPGGDTGDPTGRAGGDREETPGGAVPEGVPGEISVAGSVPEADGDPHGRDGVPHGREGSPR